MCSRTGWDDHQRRRVLQSKSGWSGRVWGFVISEDQHSLRTMQLCSLSGGCTTSGNSQLDISYLFASNEQVNNDRFRRTAYRQLVHWRFDRPSRAIGLSWYPAVLFERSETCTGLPIGRTPVSRWHASPRMEQFQHVMVMTMFVY